MIHRALVRASEVWWPWVTIPALASTVLLLFLPSEGVDAFWIAWGILAVLVPALLSLFAYRRYQQVSPHRRLPLVWVNVPAIATIVLVVLGPTKPAALAVTWSVFALILPAVTSVIAYQVRLRRRRRLAL